MPARLHAVQKMADEAWAFGKRCGKHAYSEHGCKRLRDSWSAHKITDGALKSICKSIHKTVRAERGTAHNVHSD